MSSHLMPNGRIVFASQKASSASATAGHEDAVLGLSWNRNARYQIYLSNILKYLMVTAEVETQNF